MSFFRRTRSDSPSDPGSDQSLEEIEENPELLAAEAAVNELPPPPPTAHTWGAVQGEPPAMVSFPETEDTGGEDGASEPAT
jgi:hypothetical protein